MKTIKVSERNYKWLLHLAAEIQKKRSERVSFDDALEELKVKKEEKGDIMDLAGSWEMSDEEWKEIKRSLKRGWNRWLSKSV